MWEPSKGGMGTKLKTPKRKLYMEIKLKNIKNVSVKGRNLIKRPKIIPIKKLVAGPAKETFNSPHFWSRKLYGLTGTGLAQPKIGPLPPVDISMIRGIITEPKGSRCFKGFRVKRSEYLAVGSPKE